MKFSEINRGFLRLNVKSLLESEFHLITLVMIESARDEWYLISFAAFLAFCLSKNVYLNITSYSQPL